METPRRRLMLFARLPEPGRTKTRMTGGALDAGAAAELYQAFLDDCVELCREVEAEDRELWVVRRTGAERVLGSRYPDLELRWQPEGDLGARLKGAFATAFSEGADRALIIGSDLPTLPGDHLRRGFERLAERPLVLGPARDGGYYAVGLRRSAWPRAAGLFRDIPWSTARVLEATRARAAWLGLRAAELPTWYDVDEPRDLDRLRRQVDAESATGRALARLLPDEE